MQYDCCYYCCCSHSANSYFRCVVVLNSNPNPVLQLAQASVLCVCVFCAQCCSVLKYCALVLHTIAARVIDSSITARTRTAVRKVIAIYYCCLVLTLCSVSRGTFPAFPAFSLIFILQAIQKGNKMSSTTKFVNEFCDIIDSYGGRDKVSMSIIQIVYSN